MVSGLGLDSEWRAALDINGTVESPAILSSASCCAEAMNLRGPEFRSRSADRSASAATATPDPTIDIAAEASIQGLNATDPGDRHQPETRNRSYQRARHCPGTNCCRDCCSAPRSPICRREAMQLAAAVAALQGAATASSRSTRCARRQGSTGCTSCRRTRPGRHDHPAKYHHPAHL